MTLTRLLLRTCAAVALAMSLAGCSYLATKILAPQKDISRFYVLTPTADTAAATPASAPGSNSSSDFTSGVGAIKIPPYLDRPEIVTRAAPNRLELSKEDRWGESIQNGFTSTMQRNLAAQTGTENIIIFPWYNTVHVDMQVQIDVYRFEADSQGVATLSAKWTILDSTGKNILYTVESHLTQPSKPGDTTEAAADLSSQIANMIQQLRTHQGTHPT